MYQQSVKDFSIRAEPRDDALQVLFIQLHDLTFSVSHLATKHECFPGLAHSRNKSTRWLCTCIMHRFQNPSQATYSFTFPNPHTEPCPRNPFGIPFFTHYIPLDLVNLVCVFKRYRWLGMSETCCQVPLLVHAPAFCGKRLCLDLSTVRCVSLIKVYIHIYNGLLIF